MKKKYTIYEIYHPRVDWDALKIAIKKYPSEQLIWAISLATKELPIEKLMETRGSWSTPEFPRNCGYLTEDVTHIFQCHKGD